MISMLDEFLELTKFTVPSKHEHDIRECLKTKLIALGFTVSEDNIFPENNSGNLYAHLSGNTAIAPLMFVAHMDTVTPCHNKKIIVEQDGRIHTDGTTILGSDDISGVVEILAAIRKLNSLNVQHRPIEIVFTACEEFFVKGAELLDYSRLHSKEAYILDTDGPIGRAVIAAPTGIRIISRIKGKAAHAALSPESGINAIAVASDAISNMRLGRIDQNTTANIGIIQCNGSGNIVPENCFVEGETRSLNHSSALEQRNHMADCFQKAADKYGATCEIETSIVYNAWHVSPDDQICIRFIDAAKANGISPVFEEACGGSDASMMSAHDIACLVLASGMHEIHSVREYTTIQEMEKMSDIVLSLMLSNT